MDVRHGPKFASVSGKCVQRYVDYLKMFCYVVLWSQEHLIILFFLQRLSSVKILSAQQFSWIIFTATPPSNSTSIFILLKSKIDK